MTAPENNPVDQGYSLKFLDGLIEDYLNALQEYVKKFPERLKIGELLKMIELRIKQTPSDADRRQFWEMIETVRRKVLAEHEDHDESEIDSAGDEPGEKH